MRKFNITVNGKTYQVEVEEVETSPARPAPSPMHAQPAAPVAAVPADKEPEKVEKPEKPAPAPEARAQDETPANGERIDSPMPGTILDVRVDAGAAVKRGDVLFILEAMKMENEIMAPRDGKIVKVGVIKGESVDTGRMLAVIE